MTDDTNIDDIVEGLVETYRTTVRAALTTVYRRGVRAGSMATQQAILHAVQQSPEIQDASPADAAPVAEAKAYLPAPGFAPTKARRGAVGQAIREVLTASPGLPIIEVEKRVLEANPQVAPKSIGNALRRGEGVEYRREGKYNWFLIGEPESKSSAPEWDADDLLDLGRKEVRGE